MSQALDFESGPSIVGKEERKRKLEDEEAPPVLAKRQRFLKTTPKRQNTLPSSLQDASKTAQDVAKVLSKRHELWKNNI